MSESIKLVGPEMDYALTCWFNSGDIDFADEADVMERAEIVASLMLRSGLTREQILAPLHEALRLWGPEVFDAYGDPGNVAWDFSDESEQMLRTVLTRIIDVVEKQVP